MFGKTITKGDNTSEFTSHAQPYAYYPRIYSTMLKDERRYASRTTADWRVAPSDRLTRYESKSLRSAFVTAL